jgi:hypothetical protein
MMADQLAYDAYTQLIGGVIADPQKMAFHKGQIAGMEMIFQNINNVIEQFQDYVNSFDGMTEEKEDGDSTLG